MSDTPTEPRNTFTADELTILRNKLAKIDAVHPDRLPEFHSIFDRCEEPALIQLARAKIKFLSALAANECIRRGIPREALAEAAPLHGAAKH